jgi:uncharacterized protein (TIGR02996 family)
MMGKREIARATKGIQEAVDWLDRRPTDALNSLMHVYWYHPDARLAALIDRVCARALAVKPVPAGASWDEVARRDFEFWKRPWLLEQFDWKHPEAEKRLKVLNKMFYDPRLARWAASQLELPAARPYRKLLLQRLRLLPFGEKAKGMSAAEQRAYDLELEENCQPMPAEAAFFLEKLERALDGEKPGAGGERELLAAIYANPEDDAPRLVYADWLISKGDPRVEFIALQCSDRPVRGKEKDLLAKHRTAWLGKIAPGLADAVFERGFLAKCRQSVERYLDYDLEIFRTVRHFQGEFYKDDASFLAGKNFRQLRTCGTLSLDQLADFSTDPRMKLQHVGLEWREPTATKKKLGRGIARLDLLSFREFRIPPTKHVVPLLALGAPVLGVSATPYQWSQWLRFFAPQERLKQLVLGVSDVWEQGESFLTYVYLTVTREADGLTAQMRPAGTRDVSDALLAGVAELDSKYFKRLKVKLPKNLTQKRKCQQQLERIAASVEYL